MKHPTSRQLHAYWDRLRGTRSAPERGEIEPGEIRNLLADSFILETDPAQRTGTVRLAGTRLCALFGRELRGSAFTALWGGPPGPVAAGNPWLLVETVACDTVGVVAGLTGLTVRDESLDLELLLLPLRHRGKTQARLLGALSPHCIPTWLGSRPVMRIETVSQRVLGPAVPEAVPDFAGSLPEPANDARPIRFGHLLVHDGGRSGA